MTVLLQFLLGLLQRLLRWTEYVLPAFVQQRTDGPTSCAYCVIMPHSAWRCRCLCWWLCKERRCFGCMTISYTISVDISVSSLICGRNSNRKVGARCVSLAVDVINVNVHGVLLRPSGLDAAQFSVNWSGDWEMMMRQRTVNAWQFFLCSDRVGLLKSTEMYVQYESENECRIFLHEYKLNSAYMWRAV